MLYTITASIGDKDSLWKNVVMTDSIPIGLTFNPEVDKVWLEYVEISNYIYQNGILSINLGDISINNPKVISFTARVNSDAYNKYITNTVDLIGTNGHAIAFSEEIYIKSLTRFIHIRQIILEENQMIQKPALGYIKIFIVNPTTWVDVKNIYNVAAYSGSDSNETLYSDYQLIMDLDYKGCLVSIITPQYYQYDGYLLTTTAEENHNPLNKKMSSDIHLDYDLVNEYWLTVYLKPIVTNRDLFKWNTKVNKFGTIE